MFEQPLLRPPVRRPTPLLSAFGGDHDEDKPRALKKLSYTAEELAAGQGQVRIAGPPCSGVLSSPIELSALKSFKLDFEPTARMQRLLCWPFHLATSPALCVNTLSTTPQAATLHE